MADDEVYPGDRDRRGAVDHGENHRGAVHMRPRICIGGEHHGQEIFAPEGQLSIQMPIGPKKIVLHTTPSDEEIKVEVETYHLRREIIRGIDFELEVVFWLYEGMSKEWGRYWFPKMWRPINA